MAEISPMDTIAENIKLLDGYDIRAEITQLIQERLATALIITGGNKTRAAKLLGLPSYQTLTNWMKKHGVKR